MACWPNYRLYLKHFGDQCGQDRCCFYMHAWNHFEIVVCFYSPLVFFLVDMQNFSCVKQNEQQIFTFLRSFSTCFFHKVLCTVTFKIPTIAFHSSNSRGHLEKFQARDLAALVRAYASLEETPSRFSSSKRSSTWIKSLDQLWVFCCLDAKNCWVFLLNCWVQDWLKNHWWSMRHGWEYRAYFTSDFWVAFQLGQWTR